MDVPVVGSASGRSGSTPRSDGCGRSILHRPGLELKRLTPGNKDRLLFDDVLWVARAQQEHDVFAALLRDRGVAVHLFGELLRATVEMPGGAQVRPRPDLRRPHLRPAGDRRAAQRFDAMDTDTLTEHLVGGITKREVLDRIDEPRSIAFHVLAADDFVLEPLPNHLYTRDTSAWIHDGVVDQQHAQARRACARPCTTRPCTGGIRCSPTRTSTSGPRARSTGWPRPRAGTCSCSAAGPC